MPKNETLNIVEVIDLIAKRLLPGKSPSGEIQDNGIFSIWTVANLPENVLFTAQEYLGLMNISVMTEDTDFKFAVLMEDLTVDRLNKMLDSLMVAASSMYHTEPPVTLVTFA